MEYNSGIKPKIEKDRMTTPCKICNGTAEKLFSKVILQKYPADYFRCQTCGFMQTSEPVWYEEAYNSAITSLDIGLISRNLYLKDLVSKVIDRFFPESKVMLDYGGGYGMFVRMMRDLGYNFYRQDIYCENLFAAYFDIKDTGTSRFDLLTTFEVFEHLAQPLEEIEKMFTFSDNIIFTTLLLPDKAEALEDWWYISPLTGQHLAFYSQKTLRYIAEKFGKNLYTNGENLHIFTGKKIDDKEVEAVFKAGPPSLASRVKSRLFPQQPSPVTQRTSLLQQDYSYIEKKLTHND